MSPLSDRTVQALVEGRLSTPFAVLGIHPLGEAEEPGRVVRALHPGAEGVAVLPEGGSPRPMERVHPEGLFEAVFPDEERFFRYTLEVRDGADDVRVIEDPYRFLPVLDEARLEAFKRGEELRAWEVLGARPMREDGVEGTLFSVWAPHARAVRVTGSMNDWDGRRHPMRPRGTSGVWELFLPGVGPGARYRYQIVGPEGKLLPDKADPVGFDMELRPGTASVVWGPDRYDWGDGAWMERRADWHADGEPMAVYEVHLGSWRRTEGRAPGGGRGWMTYRELADELLPYVREMGFTHVELLPVTEHPLDESWGYQTVGYFAPTSRFGSPDDFRAFVDRAHRLGLGVLLDWVPAHFPTDEHGLARFDGTHLYEHGDPRKGRHPDWGTLIFDLGRPQVRSFLLSSALFWLREYHVDGLRVDAVASMLYLDYSRKEGEWIPNVYGGRGNLEAMDFLKSLNDAVHTRSPGAVVMAEESTDWPRVSHGTDRGGLGFDMKWNMGWMNDTLDVMGRDPVLRKGLYNRLTFSIWYAFSERFLLPLSHDEVVHMKGSLLGKMPGSREEKLANLRLLYGYAWAHPGKKLLFMGGELGQESEWDARGELQWELLERPGHAGLKAYVRELNRLVREERALHELDFSEEGFEWIDCHDPERTILAFVRWARDWEDPVIVVVNFTPVRREGYRLGVPFPGEYRVLLDGSDPSWGGEGPALPRTLTAVEGRCQGRTHHLQLDLPGLAVVYLKGPSGEPGEERSMEVGEEDGR